MLARDPPKICLCCLLTLSLLIDRAAEHTHDFACHSRGAVNDFMCRSNVVSSLSFVRALPYNLLSKAQPPSHASPASSFVHELTVPGSMHRYLFHASLGSKSPIPLILSSHPFHTVTSGRASRVTTKLSAPSSVTRSGTRVLPSAVGGVYTRSVSPEKERDEASSVKVCAERTLSTYGEDWRPLTAVL